jgi:hypothetical protein
MSSINTIPLVGIFFTEADFASQNFDRLFRIYPADPLQEPPERLRALMSSLILGVDGYDGEDRIFEIPEVRSHFQRLCKQWPHWMFFSAIYEKHINAIMYCRLKSLTVLKRAGHPGCTIRRNTDELNQFFETDLENMFKLCARAEIPRADAHQRACMIAEQLSH